MARDYRRPERRQGFLLPPDMRDWVPQDDIVHLVLDAVSLMDLSKYEEGDRAGGLGQAPFAPSMLLALPIYAYSYQPAGRALRSLILISVIQGSRLRNKFMSF